MPEENEGEEVETLEVKHTGKEKGTKEIIRLLEENEK
jgi:hypothetical protein